MKETPGVDMSTGSLGQGVSAAAGMAYAAKKQGKTLRVYTLLGDGEIEEGQVWEAMMFAHHYELDNLCVIVDNNDLQIDGRIASVVDPYPIPDKFRAFGLNVIEIDGHDFESIEAALTCARKTSEVPTAIIMKTVKGKDVSYMEDKAGWHGKAPDAEEYKFAMKELGDKLAELEGK
jgi:transketolase